MSVGDSTRPTRISAVPPAVIFLLALSLLSLTFRRHLSLPLVGASQFAAGDALLRRLAATDVCGDQILAEAAALLANASVWSFPSLGNRQSTTASPTTATPHPGPSRGSGPCPASSSTSVSLPHYARSSPVTSSHRDLLGPPLPPAGLHIRGQKIGNPEMHFSRDELIGSAFIAFGITLFVCFFYVAIVSKLLPPYENQFLAAIQEDWYYCLLVPLTLPVIIVAVYLHWLSMKMFKHA